MEAASCTVCCAPVGGDSAALAVVSVLKSGLSIAQFLSEYHVVDPVPGAGTDGFLCSSCLSIVVKCDEWRAAVVRGLEALKQRKFLSSMGAPRPAVGAPVPAVKIEPPEENLVADDAERFTAAGSSWHNPGTEDQVDQPLFTSTLAVLDEATGEMVKVEAEEGKDTDVPVADAIFVSSSSSDDSSQEEEVGRNFACDQCEAKFKGKRALGVHKHKMHGAPKPFGCDVCGTGYLSQGSLKSHVAEKHSDAPFEQLCPECGEKFTSQESFRWHRRKHRERMAPKRVPCDVCGAVLADKKGLRNHKAHVHGVGEGRKRFHASCEFCGRSYTSRDLFTGHVYREHGVELPGLKKLVCPFCQQVYHSKALYDGHLAAHTQVKKFACPDCDYRSSYSSAIPKHSKHCKAKKVLDPEREKLKKFKCTKCEYRTENSGNIRKHERTCGKVTFRRRRSSVPKQPRSTS